MSATPPNAVGSNASSSGSAWRPCALAGVPNQMQAVSTMTMNAIARPPVGVPGLRLEAPGVLIPVTVEREFCITGCVNVGSASKTHGTLLTVAAVVKAQPVEASDRDVREPRHRRRLR